jgi:hypothetical protein
MVAFVGGVSIGVGGPVGWFPLGPRDVYVPWYRASRGYFNTVNVRNTTIINNTYITNVYNDYSRGRPVNGNYMWRGNAAALTAVSRDTFVGARPVMAGRVNVNAAQWRNAPVQSRLGIAPTQASFVAADARRATAMPQQAALDRRVIARSAPPPAAMPIASRVQAIERNNAQPLSRPGAQGRFAAPDGSAAASQRGAPSRVQVVGAGAGKPQPITRGNAGMDRRPGGPAQDVNPRGNADAGALAMVVTIAAACRRRASRRTAVRRQRRRRPRRPTTRDRVSATARPSRPRSRRISRAAMRSRASATVPSSRRLNRATTRSAVSADAAPSPPCSSRNRSATTSAPASAIARRRLRSRRNSRARIRRRVSATAPSNRHRSPATTISGISADAAPNPWRSRA